MQEALDVYYSHFYLNATNFKLGIHYSNTITNYWILDFFKIPGIDSVFVLTALL